MNYILASMIAFVAQTSFAQSDAPYYSINNPVDSIQWQAGKQASISWVVNSLAMFSNPQYISLDLMHGDSSNLEKVVTIATGLTPDISSYSWSVFSNISAASDYTVQITATDLNNVTSINYSARFSILPYDLTTPGSASLNYPYTGINWEAGTYQNITWAAMPEISLDGKLVMLELVAGTSQNLTVVLDIASKVQATQLSWYYQLPSDIPSGDYAIRITCTDAENNSDVNYSAWFKVSNPSTSTVAA